MFGISFPEDHSFHKNFSLEWCYFVGNLKTDLGDEIGYELSFFRSKIGTGEEIYPVHFAISLISKKQHITSQTLERSGIGLGNYSSNIIQSGDYKVQIQGMSSFLITAKPRDSKIGLNLKLEANEKEILLQGDKGYSIKSRKFPGVYSYYYSIPRLKTTGEIKNGEEVYKIVGGNSWMDHEWSLKDGENINLASSATSWDWVCLNLSDGSDVMVFNYRHNTGAASETFGSFRNKDIKQEYYSKEGQIRLVPGSQTWKSKVTGVIYPIHWKIIGKNLNLNILPKFESQEFLAISTTSNFYWEGAVTATGEVNGKSVDGQGYLELKGYTVNK